MRRPAQQHHTSPATPGWVRPYTGLPGIAVFYNDGGQSDGGAQTVPSPADLANRAPQPPAPVLPTTSRPGGDEEVLLDHRTGAPMTQSAFAKIMARENAKGRRNVLRELSEAAGVDFDPDDFDITRFGKLFKETEEARKAQLSEEQRRAEELKTWEQTLADRETRAKQLAEDAARRDRETRIRSALVSLGATGDDLEDATRLLAVPDDATDEQITQAATQLKERRGVLFGGQPAPQTLPPAPSGGPAGGNTPRQPATGTKDAVREEARKWADKLGYGRPDAA